MLVKTKAVGRRFRKQFNPGRGLVLQPDNAAVIEGRAMFPTQVRDVRGDTIGKGVLKSGHNSRKIGDRVVKGPWSGMAIYTLTLEERATCPRSCLHWRSCYGNGMPYAHRFKSGEGLEARLGAELSALNLKHRGGFVVRLHVLGDFYSIPYVVKWRKWLQLYEGLHVFGYTAWLPGTLIGDAILETRDRIWDRFAIRFSGLDTITIPAGNGARGTDLGILESSDVKTVACPAQTDDDVCCGSCGLCWNAQPKDLRIAFQAH